MRSSIGCISQACAAVLPAASPISRKASAMRGMRPQELAGQAPDERRRAPTSSQDRRVYSHGFPAEVLEAGAQLGKRDAPEPASCSASVLRPR